MNGLAQLFHIMNLNAWVDCQAPPGKFRVIFEGGVDFCDGVIGDYNTFEEAKGIADAHETLIDHGHVFDDTGKCLYSSGIV